MSNWKGTKEKCVIKVLAIGHYWISFNRLHQFTREEIEANANLFTDSINTIQECDLMPSELLKENKHLKEVLKSCRDQINHIHEVGTSSTIVSIASVLLQIEKTLKE